MTRIFGAHHLAFLGALQPGDGWYLRAAARSATINGCTLFELACNPINRMPADETAQALLAGGIHTASYCRFYPEGFGDPIGEEYEVTKALDTFAADIAFINALRANGVSVTHITGPSCFVLGGENRLDPEETEDRIIAFYSKVTELVEGENLTVCVEYLRDGEDNGVISSMKKACYLIDQINNPAIKIHGDTFHMRMRGEKPHGAIELAGSRLGYLHAHGDNRCAPGAYKLDGAVGATDTINWHLVSCALNAIAYNGPVVAEPFGQIIRDQIPELGAGLPPAIDAGRYYNLARAHFVKNGIL